MHYRLGIASRLHLDGLDAAIGGQPGVDIGAMPHVIADGRHINGLGIKNQGGLAELIGKIPFVGVGQISHGMRTIPPVTFGSALGHPLGDGVDFIRRQTPVTLQILDADVIIVGVWGHLLVRHAHADQRRPGTDLFVIGELHRPDAALAVADNTVVGNDLSHVIGIGDLAGIDRQI